MWEWLPVIMFAIFFIKAIMGLLYLAIGIPAVVQTNAYVEHRLWYGGPLSTGTEASLKEGDSFQCYESPSRHCVITMSIENTLPGPVYVAYELNNFYQNYYSYSTSRSYDQTHGVNQTVKQLTSYCGKNNYITTTLPNSTTTVVYEPCGLVAHSFFNDSITLLNNDVEMDESNIAWDSDVDFLYQNPGNWNDTRDQVNEYEFLYETYGDSKYAQGFYDKNYLNEHFIVWMRAAAFNKFKKPYGILHDGIEVPEGQDRVLLQFNVSDDFNVNQFNGSKAISIRTAQALGAGGSQIGFAWLQVGLGAFALLCAFALALQLCICPHDIRERALHHRIDYRRESFSDIQMPETHNAAE